MPAFREIRADYDRESVVVYQAYSHRIAEAALAAGRFVEPFSFQRMTWIKPSYLWLMERSNWGRKAGQERILAIRVRRSGWDKALANGVLTSFEPAVHKTFAAWRGEFDQAVIHIQWDPERTAHGKNLDARSIQVGVSRHLIREYVSDWIVQISDMTPLTAKIHKLLEEGHSDRAKRLLPSEKVYPVPKNTSTRLGMA